MPGVAEVVEVAGVVEVAEEAVGAKDKNVSHQFKLLSLFIKLFNS